MTFVRAVLLRVLDPAPLTHTYVGGIMRAHGSLHSAMAGTLLVATTLTACTSWRVQPVSPEQLLIDQRPKAVRVQRADRSRVVLNAPQLVPDSLLGTTRGQRTAVPLADITQVAVRRVNALKTGGLIFGILATTFAVIVVAIVSSDEFNN